MKPLVGKGRAFAPAHITGFFEICEDNDPRFKGSTGCGIVLNGGVETIVTPCGTGDRTVVTLNGSETEAKTTHTVVKMLTDIPVMVESTTDIPIGCGFGASGAGALGTAYALNQMLSLNLTANQLAETAHVAEVTNMSGLGDVAAQSHGGIVIRTHPGAPGYGKMDRISACEYRFSCIVLGEIPTKSVLEDTYMVGQINSAGRLALKAILRKPSLKNFMALSRDFAVDTGLLSNLALDVIEAVESAGGIASQAMIGDTVFAFPGDGVKNDLHETLKEFGDVLEYNISSFCPKLVQGY